MKLLIVIMILFVLTACNNTNQNDAQANKDTNSGIVQTGDDHIKNTDEILVEVKDETYDDNDRNRLNQAEAEELVREKLGIKKDDDLFVQYDHIEDNDYIVHVYSTNASHEKSEGWYLVNLQTRTVKHLKR
ncbi:hypothetical protein [Metabacillus malikii]|uniref:Lipoprotein n=1 Tax=Metabacillus malikii TaxID=1504265 RepID=A0ABT9ZBC0_9BACI|nr:hypothetical protein [Metabacillus malikii]MDQ0229517.1 hypothetical protein [Metabacillus malikii]